MIGRKASARTLLSGVTRVAAVLVALILLGLGIDEVAGLPPLFRTPFNLAGIGPIALGLFLEGWATYVFWTVGGGTPHPKMPPHRLVTQGPYLGSRNPLYIARLLILGGTSALLGSWGILTTTLMLFLILEVLLLPHEEQRLVARYGKEYREYRDRVPRWISWRSPHRRHVR